MSSSTLTRPDPLTTTGDFAGRLLVLEPVAASDMAPVILAPGRYHVGSGEDCDVRVTVPGVAPRHCLIVVGPHRSVVKSLAPLTWLNDGVFREAALRPGDRLVAGPIEWTVGGASASDETAWKAPAATEAVQVLCDDASSRIELSQAALHARREWEQHRRVETSVQEPVPAPAPTPSSAAINQQRAHLTELAASLSAREHEVISRETDVRCHWEDVQKNWVAVRELDQLVRSERAAVAAERAELLAERQAISAVRRELDEARADLGRRALDLTDRESSLHLRTDDTVESHSLLATRTAELQRRETEFAEREERLAQAETLVAEREHELEQRREQVDRQNAELAERELRLSQSESARAEQERGLEQRATELEQQRTGLSELESQLANREQTCAEREQELEHRRQAIEHRQAELADGEQREFARADQSQELEQRAVELEQWQAANAERESQLNQREQGFAGREQQLAEQVEAQNRQAEELARREHESSARNESLTERDRQVAERETELTSRSQAVAQSSEQLEHRERECARREQHQTELDADHAQRLRALAQREDGVNARERQLSEGDAELASRGQSLSQTDEQLAQREQECFRREQLLSQFDADHAQRVQEWSRRDEELNSKERQLNEQSRELSQRETYVAQRDDHATHRDQEFAAREDQLGRHEQELGRRDEHLAHREHELAQLDEQVAHREQELSRRDDETTRREQECAALAQARADHEAALAQRADELARREAESQRRELELSEQQRALDERLASLNSVEVPAAPAEGQAEAIAAQEADLVRLRQELNERQQQLEDTSAQLRADRDALHVAQRELEARWAGIEMEQAAVNNRRSDLERELAEFATAREELPRLRSSHEADEAIWDNRRGLLDAREQELESRAAQLDRAAADLAARSHDQPFSPQQTLLLGGPIAELLNRPGNSEWDDAAPAINQAASKDLLDERLALDQMRARIEAERDELASLRAEWDAKVSVDTLRRADLDSERSLISVQWEELRNARDEHEREFKVFVEQRHELRRQLREFAIAQGAPADLVIVDEVPTQDPAAPVLESEPAAFEATIAPEPAVEQRELEVPAAGDVSSQPVQDEAAPVGELPSGSSPTGDGLSGFGIEVMPDPVAETPAHDALATMEIDCAAFVDELGQERLFSEGSATVSASGNGGFGSPDWRPEEKFAGQDFISSTGVYDAGAALAEDRSDETIAWPPPEGLIGAEAPVADSDPEQPEAVDAPGEQDSVVALRARLAEMFGLGGSTVRVHEAPPKIPIRNVIDTIDASDHKLDLQRDAAFAAVAEEPESIEEYPPPAQHKSTPRFVDPAQQHNIPTPPPHGSNTEESIAAYMQQLLARSKTKLEVPDDLLKEAVTSDSRTRLPAPVVYEPAPVSPPPPPPKTIAPEDKEAIRANLDSFRELANISARSAVAKHQLTKLQTVVQIKFIVLGIAMGLTLLLWIAGWFTSGSYLPYTTAAAIASIVMLADVVRTTLAISRLKSMEAAGEYEAESTVARRFGVNLTPPADSDGV